MALKSDDKGFLVGVPIDNGNDYTLDILKAIKADTAALLEVNKAGQRKQVKVEKVKRRMIADTSFIGSNVVDFKSVKQKEEIVKIQAEIIRNEKRILKDNAKKVPSRRNSKGQFLKRDANGNEIEEEENPDKKKSGGVINKLKDVIGKLKDKLSGGAQDAVQDIDKVDPAVEAANEIKGIAKNFGGAVKLMLAPLSIIAMPFKSMFKKKDAAEKALPVHKKILKKLEEIYKKRDGGIGGGLFGKLGGLLGGLGGSIKGILGGVLGTIFSPVGRILSTVFMGGGRLLMTVLRGVFGPVGAVIAAGFAGWKIGTWIYEKYGADIQNAIESISTGASDAWKWVKDSWSDAISVVSDTFEVIGNSWNDLMSFAGEKLGYAKDKGKDLYNKVEDKVKSTFGISGSSESNKGILLGEMAKTSMSKDEQAMFMANMSAESGGFGRMSENMNYSSVGRIKEVFKGNKAIGRMSNDDLKGLVNNPQALGNAVYGNRMGNAGNEGYLYRGRGFTQLTGKDNYKRAGDALGYDLVNNPDLLLDPAISAKVSLWKWNESGAGKAAKAGNFDATRKAINGGMNGIADARAAYKKFSSGDIIPQDVQLAANASSANSPVLTAGVNMAVSKLALGKSAINPVSAALNVGNLKAPKATPLPVLVASGGKNTERTIIQTPAITQNIGDRGIAQLVTGGIGGGGNGI